MKVKRSFPLTSIEKVEYDDANKPTTFRLVFSNCIEILKAETAEEANDWVEKIDEGEWHNRLWLAACVYSSYNHLCNMSTFISYQILNSSVINYCHIKFLWTECLFVFFLHLCYSMF